VYVTHDQEEAMTLADRMVVLRGGEVQQFDSPGTCYSQPANRFVAAFVGMPVMNFLEGTLKDGAFHCGALRVPLPAGRWRHVAEGTAVVLGVRPDLVRVSADAQAAGLARARLEAIEQLGDRTDLVMSAGPQRIVARTAPHPSLREGDEVSLQFDAAQAHLFQPGETGARIPPQ
jgi:multiple sugar transport system ATP-binding protein